ncbi:zinc finger BED domain-containing 4-like protein [Elysia marginata]|uniref:Zinc finger BED domain-containing 4-like protein n=1 Tax=Elysia marginata TaxID=1093978 RepID=A0AAV4I017_9GAST|nr:zinc finger BED domain-containing 4-like protein [Elysia marginata]
MSVHSVEYAEAAAERAKEDTTVTAAVPRTSSSRPTAELIQPTVLATFERRKPYDNASDRKRQIDLALVRLVVGDLQPFSVVEDRWFKNFVKVLDSRYQLPSRRTLTRSLIPELYTSEKARVKNLLDSAEAVSLTTDIWTSQKT